MQFVGSCRRIVWVCLTILWGWRLKGWKLLTIFAETIHRMFDKFQKTPPNSIVNLAVDNHNTNKPIIEFPRP